MISVKKLKEEEIVELRRLNAEAIVELKRKSQLDVEAVKGSMVIPLLVDVRLSPDYIILKKENDAIHKSASKTRKQLEDARSQVDKLRRAMWNQDRTSPPSYSLFHAYEIQRDILLEVLGLERGCQMDEVLFDWVWRVASKFTNQQNLVCEMIIRGDFNLTAYQRLIHPIGHVGARSLLYQLDLENQLYHRRQIDYAVESYRDIRLLGFDVHLTELVKNFTDEECKNWRAILQEL